MTLESGKTYIGKLSALSREPDPMALRVRLEGRLSTGDWQPSALPAAAILCIRKFRDPSPGSLPLQAQNGQSATNWERAVRAALDQLIRQAVRPAHGSVPAHAEAVLFADRAELLACLANDWLIGRLTLHWWWRGLLKGMDLRLAVVRTWLDAPAYAPAALAQLSQWGAAVSFIQTFSAAEAQNLLQSVILQFSLWELHSALALVLEENKSAKHRDDLLRPQAPLSPTLPRPWRRRVPEFQSNELTLEQECLLNVSLMLQREPLVVRSPMFAEAVRKWSSTATQWNVASDDHPTSEIGTAPTRGLRMLSEEQAGLHHLVALERGRTPVTPEMNAAPANGLRMHNTEETGHHRQAEQASSLNKEESRTAKRGVEVEQDERRLLGGGNEVHEAEASLVAIHTEPYPTSFPSVIGVENEGSFTVLAPALAQRTPPILEAAIDTAWGGVFYLINVGLFLGLYGDFTSPRQPGISLPIWDFVALIGRELVGEQIEVDPVWTLLAGLSGRDAGEAAGQNFAPPESWRVPSSWLESFPEEEAWWWMVVDRRLCVHHPRGFLVLDTPLEGPDAQQQLTREMQAYGSGILLRRALSSPMNTTGGLEPLLGWLRWLMPYLRARLQRALGLLESDDLGSLLCAQQARVLVTATHVDINMSLAELPMAIRLAGLDRDPGWVPAAGRFVAFHFA